MVNHVRSSIVREEPLECLATIHVLQRLGIDYHFRDEIDFLLQQHSHRYLAAAQNCDSLLSAALSFRLVRQHGQFVPTGEVHNTRIPSFPSEHLFVSCPYCYSTINDLTVGYHRCFSSLHKWSQGSFGRCEGSACFTWSIISWDGRRRSIGSSLQPFKTTTSRDIICFIL